MNITCGGYLFGRRCIMLKAQRSSAKGVALVNAGFDAQNAMKTAREALTFDPPTFSIPLGPARTLHLGGRTFPL